MDAVGRFERPGLSRRRVARDRLKALVRLEDAAGAKPAVLFLCVHNAGRSHRQRRPGRCQFRNRAGHGRVRSDPGDSGAVAGRRRRLRVSLGVPRSAGSAATEDSEAAEREAEITDLSRRVLIGAVPAAPVVFAVMAVDLFGATWVPDVLLNRWVQLALIAPVMFYSGWPIHRTGWLTLRHRTADMNSLITIGTIAAFGYSLLVTVAPSLVPEDVREVYYEAVGVIIILILLGRLLEVRAKAGTGEAIRKLIGLQARTATLIRDGAEVDVPVDEVVPSDVVLVRPGEKVPVDGVIVDGRSTLDESMVTRIDPGQRRCRSWSPPARAQNRAS